MTLREHVSKEIKIIIVPKLRKIGFKGSFPHFKRISQDGKVDYLSFQFNKYGGSFIIEFAVAYPYKGKEGNFYYWYKITPEVIKKSTYGYTRDRLRIKPTNNDWFEFNEHNYKDIVELALKRIIENINYFDC